VIYFPNHPGNGVIQFDFHAAVDFAQTQGLDGALLHFRPVNRAPDLGDFYFCHDLKSFQFSVFGFQLTVANELETED
jgi:hypothetical protein